MSDHPLYGRPATAHLRQTKWHPIDYTRPYDPAVLVGRYPDRGPIAEGGVDLSSDILIAAGFRATAHSGRIHREYALGTGDPEDDLSRCARAVAALAAADYPVTVHSDLLERDTNVLPHLSTTALVATIEGIQCLPGPAAVDNLSHCLLDPDHGLLARLQDALDKLADQPYDRRDSARAKHVQRAADLTGAAIDDARLHYALFGLPSKAKPFSSHPTPGTDTDGIVLRDDHGRIVAEGADPATGRLLERAGFDSTASADRYELPASLQQTQTQRHCRTAYRLLSGVGRSVEVAPELLAYWGSHLAPWTAPETAAIVDRFLVADPPDAKALTHLLLGNDGAVQRAQEYLEELAWHLADQGAYERGSGVLGTSRRLRLAHEPAPAPKARAAATTRALAVALATRHADSVPAATEPHRPRGR